MSKSNSSQQKELTPKKQDFSTFLKHRIPFTYLFLKPLPILVPEANSKSWLAPVEGWLEGAAGTLHTGWTQAGEAEGTQHWGKPGRGRRITHSSSP